MGFLNLPPYSTSSSHGQFDIAASRSGQCQPAKAIAKRDTPMADYFPTTPATGGLVLERLPRVKARTGLSRSELYRRIAANPPTFPAPVKLGERASAWLEHEVTAWCEARVAARDAKAAAGSCPQKRNAPVPTLAFSKATRHLRRTA